MYLKRISGCIVFITAMIAFSVVGKAAVIECDYDKTHIAVEQTVKIDIQSDAEIKNVKYFCFYPHAHAIIGGVQNSDYDAYIKRLSEEHGLEAAFNKTSENLYSSSFTATNNGEYMICVTDEEDNLFYSSVIVCSVNPIKINVEYTDNSAVISLQNDNIEGVTYIKGLPVQYLSLPGYSAESTQTPLWGFDYPYSDTNLTDAGELYNAGTAVNDNQLTVTENGYYTFAVKMKKVPYGIWEIDTAPMFYMAVKVTDLEKDSIAEEVRFVVTESTDSFNRGYVLYNGVPVPVSHIDISCEYETVNNYEIKIDKEINSFTCSDKSCFLDEFADVALNVQVVDSANSVYWCTSDKNTVSTIYDRTEMKEITFSAAIHNEADSGTMICEYHNGNRKETFYAMSEYNGDGVYSFSFDSVPCWGSYWFELYLWDSSGNIMPLQNKVMVGNKNYDVDYISQYMY